MKNISNNLLYHGKQLFGKLVDNPSLLALIFVCLNEDPKFLTRLILISKLTSTFLFEQTELTVQAITSVPADVKAIICDGN